MYNLTQVPTRRARIVQPHNHQLHKASTVLLFTDPLYVNIPEMEAAANPPETALSGFPQSPSEFDSDPRISFSKLEDKWILETEEGTEYEYISGLKRWVPVVGI